MAKKQGILFIVSAPSGVGKTSLVKNLLELVPNLYLSISHTTRVKRPNEIDKIHYHFVSKAEFESLAESDEFLEYAEVFDNLYGTSKSWVEKQLEDGKNIILEIDWQGAKQVKEKIKNTVSIFILPPSYESLKSRLISRGDDNDTISRRMQEARSQIIHYNDYDFVVINDDFKEAVKELQDIVGMTKQNYIQQVGHYNDFVNGLLKDG